MQSKRILVTGANGQLGSEMRRLGEISPNEYIFTDVAELDITDKDAVIAFTQQNNINVIVYVCSSRNCIRKTCNIRSSASLFKFSCF